MRREVTQVGIVGAGPAGLVLVHLLAAAGIDAVVLEVHERAYVETRVRAGLLEHGTVELLCAMGVGDRLLREGLVHHGIYVQIDGDRHHIDFAALTGRAVTIYPQQEVLKDLIAAGGDVRFGVADVAVHDFGGGGEPSITFVHDGDEVELRCDVIAGCDGFHGVCRPSIPVGALHTFEHEHPFAWLGILASVAPSSDELVYAYHERGFALHTMRSPTVSRFYLQVARDEDLAAWSDARIWDELQVRLGTDGWTLAEGEITERGITPMRSFVAEPMRHGDLFLAGDAAHIVPPTGAKGLNLAVADVKVLADALVRHVHDGDDRGLDQYSTTCLERVWQVQEFSTMMTELLHVDASLDDFGRRVQRARQDRLRTSVATATALAERYVGLPMP